MDGGRRFLVRVYGGSGLLLGPWTGILVLQLHGRAGRRSLDASWVGLDVLEAVCLLTVARLVARRHRVTSPVAAATAAILALDAWFDLMSAAPQLPYLEAMVMAVCAELPLAGALVWTAWGALAWAGGPGAGDG